MLSPQQRDDDGKGRATPVPPPGPRQSPNAQKLSRVPDSNGLCLCVYWCRVRDLNSRPTVYKTAPGPAKSGQRRPADNSLSLQTPSNSHRPTVSADTAGPEILIPN